MAGHHDLGYTFLFAHPELVRELLADFTDFPALGGLAADAFERVNPGYVSDRFSERHDDIVWRARVGEQWLYIYILLEFQSGVDHWMALRMQVYIGLLYQDLVKRKAFAPQALLPPVLPLVLYNGVDPWTAATDLAALITCGPEQLAPFQAAQRYVLIDQQRLDRSVLAAKRGVLALLFRLELSDVPDVIQDVLPLLAAWLREDAQGPLRRSVVAWVEQLLVRQFRDEMTVTLLDREDDMGARKFETWADYLEDKGREEGRAEGRKQVCAAFKGLLIKRFGTLPAAALRRLDQASIDELSTWMGAALEAGSVEALLAMQADSK